MPFRKFISTAPNLNIKPPPILKCMNADQTKRMNLIVVIQQDIIKLVGFLANKQLPMPVNVFTVFVRNMNFNWHTPTHTHTHTHVHTHMRQTNEAYAHEHETDRSLTLEQTCQYADKYYLSYVLSCVWWCLSPMFGWECRRWWRACCCCFPAHLHFMCFLRAHPFRITILSTQRQTEWERERESEREREKERKKMRVQPWILVLMTTEYGNPCMRTSAY